MVLFVHGYDQDASFYAALLERWASGRLIQGFCKLYAATLAAASGMNLGFDDDRTAELLRCRTSFFFCIGNFATRYSNAIARQNLLGLVFMYLHVSSPRQKEPANAVQTRYFSGSAEMVSIALPGR